MNERLKLRANVPIALSLFSAATHIHRQTFRTIQPSLVSSSRRNAIVKTSKIRNTQLLINGKT